MTFEDQLNAITEQFGLTVSQKGDGFSIQLPPIGNNTGELDIGPDELDWYLTIQNEFLKKPYTDWLDYTGYSDDSREKLTKDKLEDIIYFLESWTSAVQIKFEVQKSLFGLVRNTRAFWNLSGKWSEIQLSEIVEN